MKEIQKLLWIPIITGFIVIALGIFFLVYINIWLGVFFIGIGIMFIFLFRDAIFPNPELKDYMESRKEKNKK